MNWPFWSLSRSAHSEDCGRIEPLLSLHADGMASPEEMRQIESHLPGCENCRESLSWMQATHRTLAARPVVAPPPDLHSRIARAIAASSAAPISLLPARTFTLRPAYAAAATLSALGLFLGYTLWHTSSEIAKVHTPKPSAVASVPVSKNPISKNPILSHMPHAAKEKLTHSLIASVSPDVAKTVRVQKRTAPVRLPASDNRIASVEPAEHALTEHLPSEHSPIAAPLQHSISHPVKALSNVTPHQLVADRKVAPAEAQQTLPVIHKNTDTPKLSQAPLLASGSLKTLPPVEVHVLPPTVTVQPPSAQTASVSAPPASQLGDILGPVKAHIGQMRTVGYLATGRSYRGTVNAIHTLDTEHFAYVDGIHSP